MILSFAVENHLSLRDRQELSLIPSAFFKEHPSTLLKCDAVEGNRVLPSAVIYGPNASGKTNLIAAFRWLRSAVSVSHSSGNADGGVPRSPFALDNACANHPTTMEIEFVVDAVRYRYGFQATDTAFDEEWLYSFPHNRRQMLFERSSPEEIRFGRTLKGQNKVIAALMRPNSLFLSAAAQNSHDQLSEIYTYIKSIRFDHTLAPKRISMPPKKESIDQRIIDFLKQIGTGVVGFRAKKKEVNSDPTVTEFATELSALVERHIPTFSEALKSNADRMDFELAHQSENDKLVYFDLGLESAGTRRLLVILRSIFSALDAGTPLFIDELDASLHTQVGEAVLALFSNPKSNPHGAQLIATTHDTNLMSSKFLRRDQIWFSEKDISGATHLFPLSDIRTRNTDNIEKGYLQGRYGAMPFSGDISSLILDN